MSRIQVRRGTAFEWTAADPTLFQGEFGFEIDTNKVKLGDGTSVWSELPYVSLDWATLANKPAVIAAGATGADARNAISAEYTGNKGASGGYASLDGTGKVPTAQLPITQAEWSTLSGKPAVVAAGATEADARTAISAEHTGNKGQANGYASLDGGGKVPVSQLPNSIMEYQGLWDADTNTPTLANGVGNAGDVYRVSVAGTRLGLTFNVGDYVIYSPATSAWEKADTTDAVSTVNGYSGSVSLGKSDVGLGNVDNTSDATKDAATATLTNKSISGSSNTLTDIGISSLSTTGTAGSTTYLRGDGSWAAISAASGTFATTEFTLQDDGDTTKQVKFQVSGVATGTTRTLTVPDASSTLEVTANKGAADGYPSLDAAGKVPLTQLPAGSFVDGVTVVGDAFQLYSGDDPVGDPVSLLIGVIDGGDPYTTSDGYIDGGTL